MSNTPLAILQSVFGYETFKPLQREVIENVLARRDTLVVMPTGGGKSLCYQVPALVFAGMTVVVSPLIALMKDQVEQLHQLGVRAIALNSSLDPSEYRGNVESVMQGNVKLLYLAPETLMMDHILAMLKDKDLACLAIDEAHCISEWGHDFRPEYRLLTRARQQFPGAVCLALTATATPRVRTDIRASLSFSEDNEFIASFNRENLYIEVIPKDDPLTQTEQFLKRFSGQSGIVYCFSRRQVDSLAQTLSARGHSVRPYHAGLDDDERRRNQEAFIRDDIQIMVATIAFGMGINKPNVRFVLHHDLPKSIESYYQEIGRAGRDGLPAHCLLLYSYGDVSKLRYFIDQKDRGERARALEQLEALLRYAEQEVACRRRPLLSYFGELSTAERCGMCDNCVGDDAELVEITVPAQKFLSCVRRTGDRFGAAHVVDVLLGSRSEKVLRFGHDRVSTYGIGKELSREQWLHLGRQMLERGLVKRDSQYLSLSLTPQALDLLRTRAPIMGIVQRVKARQSETAQRPRGEIEHDPALFELLRQKRKELADVAGVPAYAIFSDRSLIEMAAYCPRNEMEFARIHGVGLAKLKSYSQVFTEVVREYCRHMGLDSAPIQRRDEPSSRRNQEILQAYRGGESIPCISQRLEIKVSRVLNYLTRSLFEGQPLRADESLLSLSTVSPEIREQVFAAFRELGTDFLKPTFEKLNETVPYDELKILRFHYLVNATPGGQVRQS